MQRASIGHHLKKLYEDYKGESCVGIFSFDKPALVVRDLELVKRILVKDSEHFVDRLLHMDEDIDPLAAKGLFMVKGQKWKHLRSSLSPTFASGRMKNMFYLVDKCAKDLVEHLGTASAAGKNFITFIFHFLLQLR